MTPAEAHATRGEEAPVAPDTPTVASPEAPPAEAPGRAAEALRRLRLRSFDQSERERIDAVRRRVDEAGLYVVALGEFKRGKSTLLNALAGRRLLPVGVVPLTSVVTVLRRGPRRSMACAEDGSQTTLDVERLADYVTEAGNPGNRRGLSRVEITLPELDLPSHTVLVDTPGLGSVLETGSHHTLAFLPQVDVALIVLSVDQPLTEAEERLAVDLRERGAELLFALNKTDYLSGSEAAEALAFVAGRLAGVGLSDAPVFAVSAKAALDGDPASGVPELHSRLTALLEERYEALHAARAERRVLALLDELETEHLVLAEVAGRSEQELGVALEELTASRGTITRLAEEQDAVFDHRVKEVERALSDRAAAFRRALESDLLEALEPVLRGDERVDEKRVDELMAATIAAALASRTTFEAAVVQEGVGDAAARLLEALDRLAVELTRDTERVLGVTIARPQRLSPGELTPTVDVKLRDDPVGLEMLTGALQAPVPGPLRRRLLARRSRERAGELANRHAGRLRSELAAGLREAALRVRREGHEQLDGIARSIDGAVARGLEQRRLAAGEAESARRQASAELESIRAARAILVGGG
ncbi:MAG: dynamin family protein [Thermoleophilia bacterium]|nr:dynamin family protein [Thermoleophilia bacterium]